MAAKKKPDLQWVHHQAGMAIQFEWQDKAMETGDCASLDSTELLGQIPDKDIWIVACHLIATDAVADGEYWWPVTEYLAVYKQDGEPISRYATDEEIAQVSEEVSA